jgi:hypothetical protein
VPHGLKILPAGGDVWLDEHGNITCHLQENFVLLDNVSGRTVEVEIGGPAPGFLLPGNYLLRENGTIVDRTSGTTLASRRPPTNFKISNRCGSSGGKSALGHHRPRQPRRERAIVDHRSQLLHV